MSPVPPQAHTLPASLNRLDAKTCSLTGTVFFYHIIKEAQRVQEPFLFTDKAGAAALAALCARRVRHTALRAPWKRLRHFGLLKFVRSIDCGRVVSAARQLLFKPGSVDTTTHAVIPPIILTILYEASAATLTALCARCDRRAALRTPRKRLRHFWMLKFVRSIDRRSSFAPARQFLLKLDFNLLEPGRIDAV